MSINGLALRKRIIRDSRRAIGNIGKTTALAGGTDRLRDALRYDMATRSTEDESGAYIRISQCKSGTATGSGATSLTDSSAPFPGTNGLTGALVVAYTAVGAVTVLTITSDTTTALTGTAGWSNGTPSSTSAYIVTYAHVAKIIRPDPTVGDLYFDPPVTTAVVSGTEYELYYHGIFPDEPDEARDQALITRTSPWRLKPVSIVAQVEEWPTGAYSATAGGDSNATATPYTFAFPSGMFEKGMLVTNSGANGYVSPVSFQAQPGQTYRIFGQVSAVEQTASIRVRDVTGAADITITGTSTFTGLGAQWFDVTALMPSTLAGDVEIWLGGASASCIAIWAGVGVLPVHETVFHHETRVLGEHDIGQYYGYRLPTSVTGTVERWPIHDVAREPAGIGVMSTFDSPPNCPVYYYERHRYAALQSDYMSLVNRATGDGTSTDCNEDYIAWATMLELLEPRQRTPEMDRLLLVATKNLRVWDRRVGADPKVLPEFSTQGGIALRTL